MHGCKAHHLRLQDSLIINGHNQVFQCFGPYPGMEPSLLCHDVRRAVHLQNIQQEIQVIPRAKANQQLPLNSVLKSNDAAKAC